MLANFLNIFTGKLSGKFAVTACIILLYEVLFAFTSCSFITHFFLLMCWFVDTGATGS